MKKIIGIAVLGMLLISGIVYAGDMKAKGCKMMSAADMKAKGCKMAGMDATGKDGMMMHGLCCMKGTDMKVTNTDKGVMIEFTSTDKAVVKKIQENAKQMETCHMNNMAAGEKAVPLAKGEKDGEVTCPVMGTKIMKSKAVAVREYKGKKYYLCCNMCIAKWDADPAKYAK